MKCPNCGSEGLRAHVLIGISVDADDYNKLSKMVIRKKSTELLYKLEDKTTFVCDKCYYISRIEA